MAPWQLTLLDEAEPPSAPAFVAEDPVAFKHRVRPAQEAALLAELEVLPNIAKEGVS